MNPKNRLIIISVLFAFTSSLNVVFAQEKIDVSNAGQAKAKQEALAFLEANKPQPTEPLIVPDVFFSVKFDQEYKFDVPKTLENPVVIKDAKGTLAGSGTVYKFHVANEIRKTMLEVAALPASTSATPVNIYDVWLNDKKKALLTKLSKPPLPATVSIIVGLFLDDWYAEVMKVVDLEKDEAAKEVKFKLALKQAAYQFTNVAVGVQKKQAEETGGKLPVGSSGGDSSGGAGTGEAGGSGGYHHADVVHERLMNGIYRRHNRNMNKIDRVVARR